MRKFPTLSMSIICSSAKYQIPFLHPLHNPREKIIGEMLQYLIPLKPHCKPHRAYSCIISYILQKSHPPLLLLLSYNIRYVLVVFKFHKPYYVSSSMLGCRRNTCPVLYLTVLPDMQTIGYLDCGACNFPTITYVASINCWMQSNS
ncbi:hypothetical protein RYX36_035735 [Vicia faba]